MFWVILNILHGKQKEPYFIYFRRLSLSLRNIQPKWIFTVTQKPIFKSLDAM